MNDPTRQLIAVRPGFGSVQAFELLQRESRSLARSSMVPERFREVNDDGTENPNGLSNAMIALNMATRMNADPLMVMQNLYVVHGTPGWSAKFLVATFNTCGRFTAIRYAFNENGNECFAYATEIATGERLSGPTVSLAMAKAEGWIDRKGSKWRTMPDVMLRNRAAAFLIRSVAPELSLGLPMADEAADVIEIDTREVPATTPIAQVRDILARARAETRPEESADVLPPVETMPVASTPPEPIRVDDEFMPLVTEEPPNLPKKDGELSLDAEPRDAAPVPDQARPGARGRAKGPTFNVDAYARRINACASIDTLTLMHDEVAGLPASFERDDLLSVIEARTTELLPKGEPS